MKIIAGLGNIGKEYEKNRHNAGFMTIDLFLKELNKENPDLDWKEDSKLNALTIKTTYKNSEILLVKPTTLMNLSGQAVSQILSYYKENPENLVVIYDDVDLPLGKIRARENGSAGTHNGMRSIIEQIGTEDFKRIRIGIESRGETAAAHQDLSSFVLSDFNSLEQEELQKSLKEAMQVLDKMLEI